MIVEKGSVFFSVSILCAPLRLQVFVANRRVSLCRLCPWFKKLRAPFRLGVFVANRRVSPCLGVSVVQKLCAPFRLCVFAAESSAVQIPSFVTKTIYFSSLHLIKPSNDA